MGAQAGEASCDDGDGRQGRQIYDDSRRAGDEDGHAHLAHGMGHSADGACHPQLFVGQHLPQKNGNQNRQGAAGGSDRYYSTYDMRIGNGVLCTGVSQLRDPYLAIRYRSEMSSVGAMDVPSI